MTEDPRAQLEILRERRMKATGGGKTRMTEYVILTKQSGSWVELEKRIPAVSSKAALRALLNGATEAGEYVAVPARSWQPVKVEVETALKFS